MARGPSGPLHGIPIGLKDIVDTKGIPTTCGSKLLQDNIPDEDATCAARLAAAGTVLIGKLTTHEFADGGPSFDLPAPPARNPWNPEHFTAGSSSGTGAAVAAGHDPVRHRHRYRRLDPRPRRAVRHRRDEADLRAGQPRRRRAGRLHARPYRADGVDGRGLRDHAAGACRPRSARPGERQPRPSPTTAPRSAAASRDCRIGVIHHFHEIDNKVGEGTQRGITEAIATFRDLGAEIREVQLSPLQDWAACGSLISITERAAAYEEWARTRLPDFGAAHAQPADARRVRVGGGLRAGGAAAARIARRVEGGDGRPRPRADRGVPERGAKDRRRTDVGQFRPGELHDAVQRRRLPGDVGMLGLRRRRICRWRSSSSASRSRKPTVLRAADAFEKATPHRDRRPALA